MILSHFLHYKNLHSTNFAFNSFTLFFLAFELTNWNSFSWFVFSRSFTKKKWEEKLELNKTKKNILSKLIFKRISIRYRKYIILQNTMKNSMKFLKKMNFLLLGEKKSDQSPKLLKYLCFFSIYVYVMFVYDNKTFTLFI